MQTKSHAGFGLLEVLIALLLVSSAGLGFYQLQLYLFQQQLKSQQQMIAIQLAQDTAEMIGIAPDFSVWQSMLNQTKSTEQTSATKQINCRSDFCDLSSWQQSQSASLQQRAAAHGLYLQLSDQCLSSTTWCILVFDQQFTENKCRPNALTATLFKCLEFRL